MTSREEDKLYEVVVTGGQDGRSFWCCVVLHCSTTDCVVLHERVTGRTRLEAQLKAINVIKATLGGDDWLDRLRSME